MKLLGERRQLAIGFALVADPDTDEQRPERAGSWGAFQLWVAGRNLTAGVTPDGASTDQVECPLLPLVAWLAGNWDVLFHESRLPRGGNYTTSARWHTRSIEAIEADAKVADVRLDWWRRHGLGAALPDYRIPDVHIRRMGDAVELSWDDSEWRSVQPGIVLSEAQGAALIPAERVAALLYEWCQAVVQECRAQSDANVLDDLHAKLNALNSPARAVDRLRIAAGMASLEKAAKRLLDLTGLAGGDVLRTVATMLGVQQGLEEPRLVMPVTVPVLLFRSSAPTLTEADLDQLLALVPPSSGAGVCFSARKLTPCPLDPRAATQSGHELALDARETMGLHETEPLTGKQDLEKVLLPKLGISLQDVALTDRRTEGASVYLPGTSPRIAVNSVGSFSAKRWGRRMTLAHELCHLLHDGADRGVGVVSNPWAPYLVERRANAFAAHLLAPPAALHERLADDPATWTAEDLREVMHELGIGAHTLVRQLQNLRWITEQEADAWLDSLGGV